MSRDTAHAQWLRMQCQWWPIEDVKTQKSRIDKRRIFKLGGVVDHVTRHIGPLSKVKGQGYKVA